MVLLEIVEDIQSHDLGAESCFILRVCECHLYLYADYIPPSVLQLVYIQDLFRGLLLL